VNDYLRAGLIFLAVFVAIKILMYLLTKVLPVLTKKTETDLDDVILKKSRTPVTLLAILAGIRFAMGQVDLSETISQTIEGILSTLMIVFVSFLIYYVIDAFIVIGYKDFGKKVKVKVNESLLGFFHSMLKVVIVVATLLAILNNWGIEIGPLLAGIGVAGLAIAFALQSTLSNIFGGISMLLDKSIAVGDLVNLDDGTAGKILKISLRSTKIKTFDNELVIVPNGKLSESNIKNVALPEPATRVVVPFSVAYGSNVAKVKRIVLNEISKIKNLRGEPEPMIKFVEMADSSLNFKAYFYINTFDERLSALDEANTRIYEALGRNGISIPFPQMDVKIRK